jgi:hypothetical protein
MDDRQYVGNSSNCAMDDSQCAMDDRSHVARLPHDDRRVSREHPVPE